MHCPKGKLATEVGGNFDFAAEYLNDELGRYCIFCKYFYLHLSTIL